ncbi:hypothetical protein ZIOFF_045317 [Zingiber officinale]|uniref:Reticulon domain-containing protein n=1 Tax=Zingiber officinale TaxID=94328 RepID=A0A8J5FYC5_ZINOF|nr:hypothetical protein ZIOFF_045317 [Zingiber officinale]
MHVREVRAGKGVGPEHHKRKRTIPGFPFCFCRRLSEEKLAAAVRRRLLPEKAKVFRLFGREKSVHHVLGGDQGTLLPFDPTHFGILKKILAGILVGATAIWILFEFVCYHLLPLISHGLIISLLTLFLWSKALTFINK